MSTHQVSSEENQSSVQSFTSYCLWSWYQMEPLKNPFGWPKTCSKILDVKTNILKVNIALLSAKPPFFFFFFFKFSGHKQRPYDSD